MYTNGQKYKYCRLTRTYILDKTDGRTKHRVTKENVPSLVQQTRRNSTAKRKIGKFFRNTTFKRRSQFLDRVCHDSNLCIALGKENRKIKAFFNDFQGLEFIEPPIERKGTPSANGFIHRIHYRRSKYDAYAVVKSSAKTSSDNLAYEYLVGKYLNTFQNRYPLFVETYALYRYVDEGAWLHSKDTVNISKNVFFKNVDPITNGDILDADIVDTCAHSKHLALLIQDIKNPVPLNGAISISKFVMNELIYILFHIYSILHTLRKSYTHYDLHTENVLIYILPPNNHIEYVYHVSETETVRFKSQFMVKLIDYGRSFFPEAENYHKKLCRIPECYPECGNNMGYGWMNKTTTLASQHYIWSKIKNESHDLRLLKMVKNILKKYKSGIHKSGVINARFAFLDKVVFNREFGTPEKVNTGLPAKINNVSDAFMEIKREILSPGAKNKNDSDYMTNQMGVLHIHLNSDDPMRYIPA